MKKKRFGVEQIVGVLKQAEVGVPVVELIRKIGTIEATYYLWKRQYSGVGVSELRQLREENGSAEAARSGSELPLTWDSHLWKSLNTYRLYYTGSHVSKYILLFYKQLTGRRTGLVLC